MSAVHSLVTETTQHCDSVLLKEIEKHEVFVSNGIEFQWLTLERVPRKYVATRVVPPDSYSASKLSYSIMHTEKFEDICYNEPCS